MNESLSRKDLARARRGVERLLSFNLEPRARVNALALSARLAWREGGTLDPIAFAKAESPSLPEPLRPDLWAALAGAARDEGKLEAGVDLYIEALNRRTDREWLREACRLAVRAQKADALLGFFQKQRARSPRDVRWAVAVREIRAFQGDLDGAVAAAREAVAVAPEREELTRETVALLELQGRFREAADFLDGWAKTRLADEGVASWRASLYVRAGDVRKALAVDRASIAAVLATGAENAEEEAGRRTARAARRYLRLGRANAAWELAAPGGDPARVVEVPLGERRANRDRPARRDLPAPLRPVRRRRGVPPGDRAGPFSRIALPEQREALEKDLLGRSLPARRELRRRRRGAPSPLRRIGGPHPLRRGAFQETARGRSAGEGVLGKRSAGGLRRRPPSRRGGDRQGRLEPPPPRPLRLPRRLGEVPRGARGRRRAPPRARAARRRPEREDPRDRARDEGRAVRLVVPRRAVRAPRRPPRERRVEERRRRLVPDDGRVEAVPRRHRLLVEREAPRPAPVDRDAPRLLPPRRAASSARRPREPAAPRAQRRRRPRRRRPRGARRERPRRRRQRRRRPAPRSAKRRRRPRLRPALRLARARLAPGRPRRRPRHRDRESTRAARRPASGAFVPPHPGSSSSRSPASASAPPTRPASRSRPPPAAASRPAPSPPSAPPRRSATCRSPWPSTRRGSATSRRPTASPAGSASSSPPAARAGRRRRTPSCAREVRARQAKASEALFRAWERSAAPLGLAPPALAPRPGAARRRRPPRLPLRPRRPGRRRGAEAHRRGRVPRRPRRPLGEPHRDAPGRPARPLPPRGLGPRRRDLPARRRVEASPASCATRRPSSPASTPPLRADGLAAARALPDTTRLADVARRAGDLGPDARPPPPPRRRRPGRRRRGPRAPRHARSSCPGGLVAPLTLAEPDLSSSRRRAPRPRRRLARPGSPVLRAFRIVRDAKRPDLLAKATALLLPRVESRIAAAAAPADVWELAFELKSPADRPSSSPSSSGAGRAASGPAATRSPRSSPSSRGRTAPPA